MSELKELLSYDWTSIVIFLGLIIISFDKFAGIFCKWFPNTKLETRSMKEKREMAASIERQQQQIDLLSSYESDTHNDVKEIIISLWIMIVLFLHLDLLCIGYIWNLQNKAMSQGKV